MGDLQGAALADGLLEYEDHVRALHLTPIGVQAGMRNITLQLTIENDDMESVSEMMDDVRAVHNIRSAEILELKTPAERLDQEIERVLNRFSAESGSNTPDYVLASLLKSTLATWDLHTKERDRWFGNRSLLGPGNDFPAVETDETSLLR